MTTTVTKNDIKRLIAWLQARVSLVHGADEIAIGFDEPTAEDLRREGFEDALIELTVERAWWAEMVADIVETPEFAEPDEPPEQVLAYARDVVSESIRKRLGA